MLSDQQRYYSFSIWLLFLVSISPSAENLKVAEEGAQNTAVDPSTLDSLKPKLKVRPYYFRHPSKNKQ